MPSVLLEGFNDPVYRQSGTTPLSSSIAMNQPNLVVMRVKSASALLACSSLFSRTLAVQSYTINRQPATG
jgi:hypothetical protein